MGWLRLIICQPIILGKNNEAKKQNITWKNIDWIYDYSNDITKPKKQKTKKNIDI